LKIKRYFENFFSISLFFDILLNISLNVDHYVIAMSQVLVYLCTSVLGRSIIAIAGICPFPFSP